ncbi:MAG: hypothetical protein LBV59_04720 [Sphingobacterium sp.]|jgi:hypothetical protein|uniref:hypothetical protein n=1 Tax=Sphingobacterium sp. TaxID=341027 RepID=UPI00284B0EB9|nr:hypothetical protein [Sphingobacterium sp.]MDR3007213.1 hypothetical protein [Sphingobacterium sp.]
MKKIILLLYFLTFSSVVWSQVDKKIINIKLKNLICRYTADMGPTVEKAFRIATAIFNSDEFQKEISNSNFKCDSYCQGCSLISLDNQGRISGEEVLRRLFAERDVAITLELKERGGALGETTPGSYYTKAWYKNILEDMPELADDFSYGLAVNICHEYMHQVGFCHIYCTGWMWPKSRRLVERDGKPDPKFIDDDVTYKVGWVAYYILKKWVEEKKVMD